MLEFLAALGIKKATAIFVSVSLAAAAVFSFVVPAGAVDLSQHIGGGAAVWGTPYHSAMTCTNLNMTKGSEQSNSVGAFPILPHTRILTVSNNYGEKWAAAPEFGTTTDGAAFTQTDQTGVVEFVWGLSGTVQVCFGPEADAPEYGVIGLGFPTGYVPETGAPTPIPGAIVATCDSSIVGTLTINNPPDIASLEGTVWERWATNNQPTACSATLALNANTGLIADGSYAAFNVPVTISNTGTNWTINSSGERQLGSDVYLVFEALGNGLVGSGDEVTGGVLTYVGNPVRGHDGQIYCASYQNDTPNASTATITPVGLTILDSAHSQSATFTGGDIEIVGTSVHSVNGSPLGDSVMICGEAEFGGASSGWVFKTR